MKLWLGLHFIPLDADLGLLLLRVALAGLMIVFHGWEKLMTARRQFHSFPNLIGIGSELSYVLVVWLEVFGAALIALGLLTRLHALGLAFTMFIAWLLWHKRRFTGPNAGEMAFAYMFGYLLLFLAGAGRYSLDRLLGI
jgi:putative oxidoreductase